MRVHTRSFFMLFFWHSPLGINHNYVLSHSFNSICVYFSYNSFGLHARAPTFTSDWNEHWEYGDAYFFASIFFCCYCFRACSAFHLFTFRFSSAFALHASRQRRVYFSAILLALHKILRVLYVHLKTSFCIRRSIYFILFFLFSFSLSLTLSLHYYYYYFKWNFVMCSTDEIINANVIIANRRDV